MKGDIVKYEEGRVYDCMKSFMHKVLEYLQFQSRLLVLLEVIPT